jgi:hypothetical protein
MQGRVTDAGFEPEFINFGPHPLYNVVADIFESAGDQVGTTIRFVGVGKKGYQDGCAWVKMSSPEARHYTVYIGDMAAHGCWSNTHILIPFKPSSEGQYFSIYYRARNGTWHQDITFLRVHNDQWTSGSQVCTPNKDPTKRYIEAYDPGFLEIEKPIFRTSSRCDNGIFVSAS